MDGFGLTLFALFTKGVTVDGLFASVVEVSFINNRWFVPSRDLAFGGSSNRPPRTILNETYLSEDYLTPSNMSMVI